MDFRFRRSLSRFSIPVVSLSFVVCGHQREQRAEPSDIVLEQNPRMVVTYASEREGSFSSEDGSPIYNGSSGPLPFWKSKCRVTCGFIAGEPIESPGDFAWHALVEFTGSAEAAEAYAAVHTAQWDFVGQTGVEPGERFRNAWTCLAVNESLKYTHSMNMRPLGEAGQSGVYEIADIGLFQINFFWQVMQPGSNCRNLASLNVWADLFKPEASAQCAIRIMDAARLAGVPFLSRWHGWKRCVNPPPPPTPTPEPTPPVPEPTPPVPEPTPPVPEPTPPVPTPS